MPLNLRLRLVSILAWAMLLTACGGKPQKPALMANLAKEEITVVQLRAINYEYAGRFGQLVSTCAVDILGQTEDRKIREQAMLWRMYISPEARSAAFNHDPLAGMLELWVLAGQQRRFLTTGGGTDYFGDYQECAIATSIQLEKEIEEIAAEVMPAQDVEKMKERVDAWVEANPIEALVRPTAQADLASLVHEEAAGGLKSVASIEETFKDLNDRLAILTVQMPVEARWQAEYLTYVLFEDRFDEPAQSVVRTMNHLDEFLDEFEGSLSVQTQALLDGIAREREALFDAVGQERTDIVGAVEYEREAIVEAVDTQVDTMVERLDDTGRGLIDHFFARLITVMIAAGVFAVVLVLLVLVALRKRGGPPVVLPPQAQPPSKPPERDRD